MAARGYDVVVVGAGMVGSMLAASLKGSPLSVALLDAGGRPPPPPADRCDLRVSAVSPGSRHALRAAGAWDRMVPDRIGPYQSMYVWDASSNGSIEFDAAEVGEPWLGYIIENANIHHALLASIEEASNVDLRFGAVPSSLSVNDSQCRLTLENGSSLTAALVVGADGARSWVREELGIDVDVRLYGERAFVCEAATERSHGMTAWQRFLPSGPLAFLPLANGCCSVVWTCDAELAAELEELDPEAFGRRLEDAFERRLGAVEVVGPIGSFDLSRRRAARYIAPRGALIGDAAHVVHPLAGQGVNLGFADAGALAAVVLDAQRRGRDIGRRDVLRRYERWRRSDNLSMMRMLDALHGLFSSESPAWHLARGLGLRLVDRQDWLKRFLARQAMGGPRSAP